MARSTSQFQTIRSEGALLPPDVLRAIASQKVEGTSPESYHLPPGTKLNEAIAHSWSVLQKHWKAFQEFRCRLPQQETGTEVTNQNWLLPLFEELKYGRLVTTKAPEIDDRTYPIERFYGQSPIHLVGCNLPLDRRTKGARGAATASPHSMMQEFLNRSEGSLWGFFSNGLVLRILRDNVSLSRQAYVEFDLEAMMEGEVYADFALLWMLCHQSRVEGDKPQDFWLEKWSQIARQQGTRVLSDLRSGVAKAIEALGRGFLAHPCNDWLRQQLQDGQLDKQEYYRQVLRIVYRLLFLFVAEDRGLLHGPDAESAACDLYDAHYSTRRLRELADQIRGSKHADLWHSLSLVFDALGRPQGCPQLGLPALGSFLWRRTTISELIGPAHKGAEPVEHSVLISNDELLSAVRALAFVEQDKARRSVDYRNLGSEELGSVYESLLELHPAVNIPGRTFELDIAAGHERKTTGSYYTPDSLVQCLLDSALEPVVAERIKGKKADEAANAILDLKVCDPACGSGHFLIATAHRLARHLARVRSGEAEPSPADHQHALRDVIGHCIYGVDVNPMAVELCKVSLWMEALEPGKPLSFLDHHVQCGNSLLGATPVLLKKGIPDKAFEPIEGDDKKLCKEYKKQNRDERRGQKTLFAEGGRPWERMGDLAVAMANFDTADDDSIDRIRHKEERYAQLVGSADYLSGRFWADAWCAAFFWKKVREFDYSITEDVFRRIERNPHDCAPWMRDEILRLAQEHLFFHWHHAFPHIIQALPASEARDGTTGWSGGFDVVLGNPPWVRQELLKSIKPFLANYEAFAGTADSSVYFLEVALRITRANGRVAMLTPNKWFRANYAEPLRVVLREQCRMCLLIDFGHSRDLFPDADTFPAAIVLAPAESRVPDTENAYFVQAHDSDRERNTLQELIGNRTIPVPHGNLKPERWQLESADASRLLDRLMATGVHVKNLLARPMFRGLLTGFNEAFYIDSELRDDLIASNPQADAIIKRFLRGRDVKRWAPQWDHQWHIVIPSSQNKNWPWAQAENDAEAEAIFSAHYPAVYSHLKKFEEPLRRREDQGKYWWELRACDYYSDFDKPKIVVQCIAYYSQFALDTNGFYLNNKAIAIPTDDLFILAVLNSRVTWWIVNRTFQHMKDEGLSVDVQFLMDLPIPEATPRLRGDIETTTRQLVSLGSESAPNDSALRSLEIKLNELVQDAFQLSSQERSTLASTLPPRDPIVSIELGTPARTAPPLPDTDLVRPALGLGTGPQLEIDQPTETVPAVFEEVSVSEFAAMAYPATETDKAICAAALAVVTQSGSLSSMEHLDSLLLATHPDWCKAFLDKRGQAAFDTARRSAPAALFVNQGQSIRWKECRDYLEQLNAIEVAHSGKNQPIGAGTALTSVKASLPTGVDSVVKYVFMALARIRELRRDPASVPQAQRLILDVFEAQHRLCGLAA